MYKLLEQCQIWHENDEYQKIVDALEAVLEEERTPEMDSELARAYNNLADPGKPEGIDMFRRAIGLLKRHEEYFEGDHFWNFRMGYAYYHLDQEGIALRYFEKALEARPGDGDTQEFIGYCKDYITLPRFGKSFRERTKTAWETFAGQKAELRRFMDEDKKHEYGKELMEKCDKILHLAFEDISFEMGYGGEKHELILTPEGDKVKLFELAYFQKHAPAQVLENWNILVGRQPAKNIGLRFGSWEISGDDVQIWIEQLEENSFSLAAYCEKMLLMLQEDEDRVWWMLTTLTDQVLGEISHMRYIDSFDVLAAPKEGPFILLSKLPGTLKDMGLDLSTNPEALLESYTSYQMEPDKNPNADWRLDIIAGSTCCPSFINEYMKAESVYMDDFHADGAVAGFLCYPLDSFNDFEGEERTKRIFDFRDKLEAALTEDAGAEFLTLTGGATGVYCGYLGYECTYFPAP